MRVNLFTKYREMRVKEGKKIKNRNWGKSGKRGKTGKVSKTLNEKIISACFGHFILFSPLFQFFLRFLLFLLFPEICPIREKRNCAPGQWCPHHYTLITVQGCPIFPLDYTPLSPHYGTDYSPFTLQGCPIFPPDLTPLYAHNCTGVSNLSSGLFTIIT